MDNGIIGVIIGIVGGTIGVYYSIKNTSSDKERMYMINFTVFIVVIVIGLLSIIFFVDYPGAFWVLTPFFGIVLPAIIYFANIKQMQNEKSNVKRCMT